MRKVIISDVVQAGIIELNSYLTQEFKLSRAAADARTQRMENFVATLSNNVDYPLCRFKRWRVLGWRCAIFEKDWIFAYEVFDGGVIVRDMSHTALLKE